MNRLLPTARAANAGRRALAILPLLAQAACATTPGPAPQVVIAPAPPPAIASTAPARTEQCTALVEAINQGVVALEKMGKSDDPTGVKDIEHGEQLLHQDGVGDRRQRCTARRQSVGPLPGRTSHRAGCRRPPLGLPAPVMGDSGRDGPELLLDGKRWDATRRMYAVRDATLSCSENVGTGRAGDSLKRKTLGRDALESSRDGRDVVLLGRGRGENGRRFLGMDAAAS